MTDSIPLNVPPGVSASFLTIPPEQLEELDTLLFGRSRDHLDLEAWKRQPFKFSNRTGYTFGLEQSRGGPCGVLASVQAEIIKYMVWVRSQLTSTDSDGPTGAADGSNEAKVATTIASTEVPNLDWLPRWCNPNDHVECKRLFVAPLASHRYEALVVSFVGIIARAVLAPCEDRETERFRQSRIAELSQAFQPMADLIRDTPAPPLQYDPLTPITLVLCTRNITAAESGEENSSVTASSPADGNHDDTKGTAEQLQAERIVSLVVPAKWAVLLLLANPDLLQSGRGVLSFVYSLIASRTVRVVQADMDDPTERLVVRFGHTSQELVNLMITGVACSNVFDDNRSMTLSDSEMSGAGSMRGVSSVPDIGYLSVHEALRYLEVGDRLKNPKYPLWIVGSESHYTVLFALDQRVGKRSEREQQEAELKAIFQQLDPQNNGFLSYESAAVFCAALGRNFDEMRDRLDPAGNGIVLWTDARDTFVPETATKSDMASAENIADAELKQKQLNHVKSVGDVRASSETAQNSASQSTPVRDLSPWTCQVCTFYNENGAQTRCSICDEPKPKPKPQPQPQPAPAATSTTSATSTNPVQQRLPADPTSLRLPRAPGPDQPQSFSLYHINGLGGAPKSTAQPSDQRKEIETLTQRVEELRSTYESALAYAQASALQLEMALEDCIAAGLIDNPKVHHERLVRAEKQLSEAQERMQRQQAEHLAKSSSTEATACGQSSSAGASTAAPNPFPEDSCIGPDVATSVVIKECLVSLIDPADVVATAPSVVLTIRDIITTRWKTAVVEFGDGDPSLN